MSQTPNTLDGTENHLLWKTVRKSKLSPYEGKKDACPEFKSDTSMKNEIGGGK